MSAKEKGKAPDKETEGREALQEDKGKGENSGSCQANVLWRLCYYRGPRFGTSPIVMGVFGYSI